MIFVRRDGRSGNRLLGLRVGLFFLAAGLWLAGVSVGNDVVTAMAIGVVVVAIAIGLFVRRRPTDAG